MRFKTFLQEGQEYSLDEAIKKIASECKPFLAQVGTTPLFRGIPHTTVTRSGANELPRDRVHFTDHPVDRAPKDSTKTFNFMFDAMIECAFNIPKIRSRTIFATGDAGDANLHGALHFMFPAGEISFLGSSSIRDSYESLGTISAAIDSKLQKYTGVSGIDFAPEGFAVLKNNYSDKSTGDAAHAWITNADKKSQAITIKALSYDQKTVPAYADDGGFDLLKEALTFVGNRFYSEMPLSKAIKSKNEILIYKTNGYYSVPVNFIHSEMQREGAFIANRFQYNLMFKYLLDKIKAA